MTLFDFDFKSSRQQAESRGGVPNVRQSCNRILNIAACPQTRSLIAVKVFQFVPLELGESRDDLAFKSRCECKGK